MRATGKGWARIWRSRDIGVFVAALAVALFFTIFAPRFLTAYNLFNIVRQAAELGIIAMAMTILITSGEFDLSVGALYAVSGIVTGLVFKRLDVSLWLGGAVAVLFCLGLGFLNGLLVLKTKMHSFIATLATMMVYRGVAMVLSQGQPVSAFPDQFFFEFFGRSRLFGSLPVPIVWFFLAAIVLFFVLHRTLFGIHVFATGGNREAATLAGINTGRVKQISFMITAGSAAFAGLISLGYLKSVTPTQGTGLELEAIAASVIGGTSMRGGVGSIVGAFLGAFIMAEVRTGLVLMGTDAYVQDAFVGLIIALAVIINVRFGRGGS